MVRVHINRGVNPEWIVQGKVHGGRRWWEVCRRTDQSAAYADAASALQRGMYKRLRIIHVAEYYEPLLVAVMERV